MIRENSKFRFSWDILIIIVVIISSTLIPYQIVFNENISSSGKIILYLIDIIFIADIIFNFFTSYKYQGNEVLDRKKTIKKYLKSSFTIDLLANIPLLYIFDNHEFSFIYLLFLLRILRINRLFVILNRMERFSWVNSAYIRITKFIAIVFTLIHWIACIWFFIPNSEGFPEDSWAVGAEITEAKPQTQYIRSLYWSITTMTTVGYGDIGPGRNSEYIFTMIVMMIGASMYAFIIGNIASLFSNLDSVKIQHQSRVDSVTQYLTNRQISPKLHDQVRSYYDYVWDRHRGLNERELFEDLPHPLKIDVLIQLTKELLDKVPLFKESSNALRNVILSALKPATYNPKGFIVRKNEPGDAIYFISRGKVEILTDNDTKTFDTLFEGEYFGDMSMILMEKRTASVRAVTYCELFILEKNDFLYFKEEFPEFKEVLKKISSQKTDKATNMILEGIVI